jgi:hypothetical protein
MEDLWFKAYAVDAQHQLLSAVDQTLYIQLIHEKKDSIVWQEKYPIKEGIASGHIYLDGLLPEGNYWLCAYSAHSLTAKATRRIRIVKNVAELLRKKTYADSLPEKIQFSLLPEGGSLLSGVTNRIAFKAVGANGLPCPVSGTLFDGDKAWAVSSSGLNPAATITSVWMHLLQTHFIRCPESGKRECPSGC